ncbi:UDP-N-acetylmuramoyl-L-alanine--D-glutamate ligase [Candidatus Microgenomates bacterium]|nr:UDP-N-acetylmuramoyl-L-alanine--D-glutamate ligase [Candidatus Microgenomates bacterium]
MKVAILGLGTDTKDVIPYLESRGDLVTVLDEKNGKGFFNLDSYDLIIRSPGVYRYREELEKTKTQITSKIKMFFDLCPAKIIGVTGTKGKGTTSTLIYEILKAAGKKVFLGGNIGTGIFHLLPELDKDCWVVLELSSFQLIDLDESPHIAVVLMVTKDHMDWHVDEEEYVNAKKNIVSHQKPTDFAVVNKDYPNSVEIGNSATGKVTWVSKDALKNMTDKEIRLRGEHNRENIVAAATVAKLIDIDEVTIRAVIKNFKGLEHRLEEVREVNGVTYYNDSFSTVPETAIAAIKSFHEPEILILGGSEKGSDFTKLGRVIAQTENIRAVILIGLMAGRIEKAIKSSDTQNKVKIIKDCQNMEEIVKIAYNTAVSGDVVLLTPACASFDMFKNYKERGQQFKLQVNSL